MVDAALAARAALDDAQALRAGWERVLERMAKAMDEAGRKDDLALVAVSKFHPVAAIAAVAKAGQVDFGENYLQEALAKQEDLARETDVCVRWHFVGHVQSRKAKDVVGKFSLIHTLDSEKLALMLEKHAEERQIRQAVLVQVNVGAEEQKSGVAVNKLAALAECVAACPHLDLQGLMCLPPVFDAGLKARPYFALLRELRQDVRARTGLPLPHLSMGMSGDLEAAVLEGATLVRVGTDIFGMRPSK